MEATKKENVTTEDIDLQADNLIELPVTKEQADKISGGASPKLFLACAKGNHIPEA